MANKQKRVDDAKKRDKRSKVMLAALGVVLVVVAVIEVPSMLKVMNKKPPPGSTYDPGPSSAAPGLPGLPDVAAGATPVAKAPSGQLVDTDVPPTSGAGQLVTFEVFQTKNPFVPQVTTASGTTDTSAPATSTVPTANNPPRIAPTSVTPTSTKPSSAVPSAGGSSAPPASLPPATTLPTTTAPTTTTPSVPAAPRVTISVNGVATMVGVAGTFPAGAPVFRLVSFKAGTAQIGIVGGSYAAGGATLALQMGRPVTLQNTTDGKQYKLELLKTP